MFSFSITQPNRLYVHCWILAFLAATALPGQTEPPDAKALIQAGIRHYGERRYSQAYSDFQNAGIVDDSNVDAHVYAAQALLAAYVQEPGFAEDRAWTPRVQKELDRVLELDPANRRAWALLARFRLEEAGLIPAFEDDGAKSAKLEESRKWSLKILDAEPQNQDASYLVAFVDWMEWNSSLMNARAEIGMKPDDPGPLHDNARRQELKRKHGRVIEDALVRLRKALAVDPEYVDGMTLLNLVFRARADLADSPAQYRADMDRARQWFQKASAVMERKTVAAPLPKLPRIEPPADPKPSEGLGNLLKAAPPAKQPLP